METMLLELKTVDILTDPSQNCFAIAALPCLSAFSPKLLGEPKIADSEGVGIAARVAV
jgi:hypothetical protein